MSGHIVFCAYSTFAEKSKKKISVNWSRIANEHDDIYRKLKMDNVKVLKLT